MCQTSKIDEYHIIADQPRNALSFANYDVTSIQTPIKVDKLVSMLQDYNYVPKEVEFLKDGFTNGFDIGYSGNTNRKSTSDNIPLRVGSKTELWNKLMNEVKLKRVAEPYKKEHIPFDNYIQLPIGLVPKAGKTNKTRLIFHLSYDISEDEKSFNFNTPKEICSVKYRDLDHADHNYLKLRRVAETSRTVSSYLQLSN